MNAILKKFVILSGALFVLFASQVSYAQNAEAYLRLIWINTTNILDKINKLPQVLDELYFKKWRETDTSETSSNMQSNFSQFGQLLSQQPEQQLQFARTKLNPDLLNTHIGSVLNANLNLPNPALFAGALQKNMPFANDILYTTLLGHPYFQNTRKGADEPYNYIRNASGMNIYHPLPEMKWLGPEMAKSRYRSYYNTVMAGESFNSYILSAQYIENKIIEKNKELGDLRSRLLKQATDSDSWFTQVSKENIGFVLRQILMYQSQVFVLLNELLETNKRLLTAQVINNSLLIAVNQQNENVLLFNAQRQG